MLLRDAFWLAYILTRPLGASIGDYLSQARSDDGLGLGPTTTSAVFLLGIPAALAISCAFPIMRPKAGTACRKPDVIPLRDAPPRWSRSGWCCSCPAPGPCR